MGTCTRERGVYKAYSWPGKEFTGTIIYPEIQDLLLRRGWSLSRLAEEAGCTPATIRCIVTGLKLKNGKKVPYNPTQQKLEDIAKRLGYSVEMLFDIPEAKKEVDNERG